MKWPPNPWYEPTPEEAEYDEKVQQQWLAAWKEDMIQQQENASQPPLMPPEASEALQQWASRFAEYWGFDAEIDQSISSELIIFNCLVAPPPDPLPPDLLNGSQLLSRWNASPKKLCDKLPWRLPIYISRGPSALIRAVEWEPGESWVTPQFLERYGLDEADELVPINDHFTGEIVSKAGEKVSSRKQDIKWFRLVPWWIFKLAEVEFFEKLFPEICGKDVSSRVSHWLTFAELRARWKGISAWKLQELVCNNPLPVYQLSNVSGIELVDAKSSLGINWLAGSTLDWRLFRLSDVHAFELADVERPAAERLLTLSRAEIDTLIAYDLVKKEVVRIGQPARPNKARALLDSINALGRHLSDKSYDLILKDKKFNDLLDRRPGRDPKRS